MTFSETVLRVGVDWENKGFISLGTKITDALNIFPDPLFYNNLQYEISASSTLTKLNSPHSLRSIDSQYDSTYLALSSAYLAPVSLKVFANTVGDFVDIGVNGSTRSIPVTANLAYSVKVWAASRDNFNIAFYQYRTGTGTWSQVDTDALTVGGLNTVSLTGTVAADATHVKVRAILDATTTDKLIYIQGILITQSTTSPEFFNPGTALCIYDDITSYVMDVNGNEGKSSWDSLLPDEGNLSVTLKNDSRIFSPEYSSGALFGKHKTQKRIIVRLKRNVDAYGDDWVTIWSGYISKYDVEPNQFGGRTATIEARQGYFNLEKIIVPRRLFKDGKQTDLLHHVLYYGYETFGNPTVAKLGWSKLSGATFLFNPAQCFDRFGNDTSTSIPVVGHNWDEFIEATELLSWITQFWLGHSFITATGQIGFVDRSWFSSLVFDAQDFSNYMSYDYEYGIEIRNKIISDVSDHQWHLDVGDNYLIYFSDDQTIAANEIKTYDTKFNRSIPVTSQPTAVEIFSSPPFLQPENFIMFNPGAFLGFIIDGKKQSDGTFVSSSTLSLVGYESPEEFLWEKTYRPEPYYTGRRIIRKNLNNFDVSFRNAQAVGGLSGVYEFGIYLNAIYPQFTTIDTTSSSEFGIKSIIVNEDDLPILHSNYTSDFHNRLLARYATDVGWFSNLGLTVENTETFPFEYPGTGLRLNNEYQTGVVNKDLLIIGREFSYQPQLLKFNYRLAPAR